ncbi:MAG: hypothetical protein FJY65_04085 [Calditrichaeota bacterium]|nr:hypothetical protein [Calditrichota bacterium]
MSYDLGLRGNYEELYTWLDNLEARECGDASATFKSSLSPEQIKAELKKALNKEARIYLIGFVDGQLRGKFILGRRKVRADWSGYAVETDEVDEDIL